MRPTHDTVADIAIGSDLLEHARHLFLFVLFQINTYTVYKQLEVGVVENINCSGVSENTMSL